MNILQKTLRMLEEYPLCDHCLGRQFALLGHGLENAKRGEAIKLVLTFNGHEATLLDRREGEQILNVLATNGFSKTAVSVLEGLGRPAPGKASSVECYLCADTFKVTKNLVEKSVALLGDYEYNTLLVGTELPVDVAEREDEFRAEFGVLHAE